LSSVVYVSFEVKVRGGGLREGRGKTKSIQL
jgi:hypothetical protein